MNKIDPQTEQRIIRLIEAGCSTRMIASKTGVNRGTASRYSHLYRDRYPKCQHGMPLPECSSCITRRRIPGKGRDIIWLQQGPRPKKERDAADVLLDAARDALEELSQDSSSNCQIVGG